MTKKQKIWLAFNVTIKTLTIYLLGFLAMFLLVTVVCITATKNDKATERSEIDISIFTLSKSASSKIAEANQITEPQQQHKSLYDFSRAKYIAKKAEKKEAIYKKAEEKLEKAALIKIREEKRRKKLERKRKLAEERARKEAEQKAAAEKRAQETANRQWHSASHYSKKNVELLAHLINGEAGNQSNECQQAVGQVVVNRANSDDFKQDTIEEVIFAPGQYACTWDGNFDKEPTEAAYKNAEAVLSGDTDIEIPENVVFQAQFTQGSGVWKVIGTEIFCYK